jgi:hypothetical protein
MGICQIKTLEAKCDISSEHTVRVRFGMASATRCGRVSPAGSASHFSINLCPTGTHWWADVSSVVLCVLCVCG